MPRGNGAALDDWIERSWPDTKPPWTRSAFRELYNEEQRAAAAERRERLDAQRIRRLEKDNEALQKRIAALEQRTSAGGPLIGALADAVPRLIDDMIEQRGCLRHRGVWNADTDYRTGAAVTHGGAVWAATAPTKGERPGAGATAWRLIAKGEPARKEPVAR